MTPITVEQWEECHKRTGSTQELRERLSEDIDNHPDRFDLLRASYESWCLWFDIKNAH